MAKRKPPPKSAWKKGQTGNAGGRPREWYDMRALIREHGITNDAIEALRAALAEPGERVPAARVILSYSLGLPTQPIEVSGPDGGPIESKAEVIEREPDIDRARAILAILTDVGALPAGLSLPPVGTEVVAVRATPTDAEAGSLPVADEP